jgi:hypothetical protein
MDDGVRSEEAAVQESRPEEISSGQVPDIRAMVHAVLQEFLPQKTELEETRKQRDDLGRRLQELTAENARTRERAEEAERSVAVRAELQKQGVSKLDLAYRAIRDEFRRDEDGKLQARGGGDVRDYVKQFVTENPELLPARVAGGSGAVANQQSAPAGGGVDFERIRPGMSPDEMERVRQEIARVASQTLRGL